VLRLTTNQLEIQCDRTTDRYSSKILANSGSGFHAVLRSIEGSNQDSAPPSPPIQQAVLDEIGTDQKAILGVGMSGKSHWSSSVHWDQAASQMVFDIACRCNENINWLGSSYECCEDSQVEMQPQGVLLRKHNQTIATLVALDHCALSILDHRIQIIANLAGSEKLPRTIRWQYAIRISQ
jgi:hypothetical protein